MVDLARSLGFSRIRYRTVRWTNFRAELWLAWIIKFWAFWCIAGRADGLPKFHYSKHGNKEFCPERTEHWTTFRVDGWAAFRAKYRIVFWTALWAAFRAKHWTTFRSTQWPSIRWTGMYPTCSSPLPSLAYRCYP